MNDGGRASSPATRPRLIMKACTENMSIVVDSHTINPITKRFLLPFQRISDGCCQGLPAMWSSRLSVQETE